jgi:hypothetical protein
MSQNPLFGTRIKINRAKQHFFELNTQVSAFLERKPYRLVEEEDAASQQIVYKLVENERIPDYWGGIVGDVIHNLRASLDHLAVQVMAKSGITDPGRLYDVHFPISKSAVAFENALKGKLKGAHPDAVAIVERLKPYRGGTDTFWSLHKLDIMDKHHVLVPVGMAFSRIMRLMKPKLIPFEGESLEGFPEDLTFNVMPRLDDKPIKAYPLENGTVLWSRPIFHRSGKRDENKYEVKMLFHVAFGEGQIIDGEPVIPALKNFIDFVESVLDIFEKEFFRI